MTPKFHMTRAEVEQLEQHIEKREEAYRACNPGKPVILDLTDIDGRKLEFCRTARSYEYRQATYAKCEGLREQAKDCEKQARDFRKRVEVIEEERAFAGSQGRAAPRRKREPKELFRDADRLDKEATRLREQADSLWDDLPL